MTGEGKEDSGVQQEQAVKDPGRAEDAKAVPTPAQGAKRSRREYQDADMDIIAAKELSYSDVANTILKVGRVVLPRAMVRGRKLVADWEGSGAASLCMIDDVGWMCL